MMSAAGIDSDIDLGHELEDGELTDSEVEEGTYVPLVRPDNLTAQLNPASIMNMQIQDDHTDESCQDTSSSGSESEGLKERSRPKKPKIKLKHNSSRPKVVDGKQAKYNIWSKTLQEDVLTEDMNSCEFLGSRNLGIESYDHRIKYRVNDSVNSFNKTHTDLDLDPNSTELDLSNHSLNRFSLKRKSKDRKNVKLRLGRRHSIDSEQNERGPTRDLPNLKVTKDSSVEEVAIDLAEKLCEDKDGLILRAVTIAGKEKAIEIYQETKRIEEDGGMMVMNGLRRRTPGGVYFFLLKRDDKLTKDSIKEIFQEDRQEVNRMKKRSQARHREKKVQQLKQSLTDRDLPALLTRAEQALQGSSAGISDRGTSDGVVSNPPPSPVTDGKDGSSDTDTQRSPNHVHSLNDQSMNVNSGVCSLSKPDKRDTNNYDEDFLEINCGDDMDLF